MENEWKVCQLQDVVTLLGDGLHGTPEYDENGECHFINGNNLENGRIVFRTTTKRVSEEQFQKHKKELTDRTVMVSINGTIGNIAYYNGEKVILGKSACYFNLIDGVSKEFVRYSLAGRQFLAYLESFATGTTIKNVSLKSMREFPLRLPPLPIQKSIAHILGTLDDKIELNRRMNETLESMARALFKSWFVDFDPVIDNALAAGNPIPEPLSARAQTRRDLGTKRKPLPKNIQKLFPDTFVSDEKMGWVPNGWKITTLPDLGEVNRGRSRHRPRHADHLYGGPYPFVQTGDIKASEGRITGFEQTYSEDGLAQSRLWPEGTMCITIAANIAETAVLTFPACFPDSVIGFIPDESKCNVYIAEYTFRLLKEKLQREATGSVQDNINLATISRTFFLFAPIDVQASFVEIFAPKNEQIIRNLRESQTLTKLRDTLLPKLLSGELRIPDAEKLVAGSL